MFLLIMIVQNINKWIVEETTLFDQIILCVIKIYLWKINIYKIILKNYLKNKLIFNICENCSIIRGHVISYNLNHICTMWRVW